MRLVAWEAASMEQKHRHVDITKSDSSDFDARFILSAATPDRVQDTIDPAAYRKASRIDKLIALFNHDPAKPVGYWTELKAVDDTLTGYLRFAGTNLGRMLKQLIDDGVPLGASIGFRGQGEPNKKGGIHFTDIELMETSIVSIPAHPRALQIMKNYEVDLPSSVLVDESAASGIDKDPEKLIANAKNVILLANRTLRKKL